MGIDNGINKRHKLLKIRPNCSYCNRPLTMKTATLDHIIPRSKGGTDAMKNLTLACKKCNELKSDNETFCPVAHFIKERGYPIVTEYNKKDYKL